MNFQTGVDIITQPEKDSETKHGSPQEVLNKVREYLADNEELKETNSISDEDEGYDSSDCSISPQQSHEAMEKQHPQEGHNGESSNKEKGGKIPSEVEQNNEAEDNSSSEETLTDSEGIKVPQKKIALDGHFTTNEFKTLLQISKEEGLISEDVTMKIIDRNDQFGDKIQIFDGSVNDNDNSEKGSPKDTEAPGDDK